MSREEGESAFTRFCDFGITSINHPALHVHAWTIADQLSMPKAYDAQYLALADILECDVWTMDRRLINAVQGRFRRLRPVT